jgi:hypothetical protein
VLSYVFFIISFRPSILAISSKKRTTTTDEIPDEIDAKKPKIETAAEPAPNSFVFKKPLPVSSKPKKSALEEVREVISSFFFYIPSNHLL